MKSQDDYLPQTQTCFFTLSIPKYSSKAIMKEKFLYAMEHTFTMDADVQLHTADGWNDI